MRRTRVFLLLILILNGLAGCGPKPKTPLVVMAAGSLIQPFADLKKGFEAAHPEIDVQDEYHGSIQVIRQVSDLHRSVDVVASADYALIPLLMYPDDPQTGKPDASWSIQFATNRLGLAYTAKSRYADEITADNWYQVLQRPDVRIALADPRFDAVGYRALMAYQLGQEYYRKPTLFFDAFDGVFKSPIVVEDESGTAVIHVPEILETKAGARVLLRGASVQALALLETGEADYAFEYESVIQQHGLQAIHLPDELNLGAKAMNSNYGKVSVRLDFQRFAKVKPEFHGEQIQYGITIPATAEHPEEAAAFVAYLLGPEGRKIMEQDHHALFDTASADRPDALPEALKTLVGAAP